MVHIYASCTIPYDAHRLVLLPFAPAATPWAGERKREPLQHSFNFITARRLGSLSKRSDLKPEFARGVTAQSFKRLPADLSLPPGTAQAWPSWLVFSRHRNHSSAAPMVPLLATPMIMGATKSLNGVP